jgi:hypothetical protein
MGGIQMRRNVFAVVAIAIVIVASITVTVVAQNEELIYKETSNILKYKNQIKLSNITETNKVHLGTRIALTCYLENTIEKRDDQLILRTRFTDFSLDEMKRELQIVGNEVRDVGPRDLTFMSHVFKRHLYDKWIQLAFTEDGTVLTRRYDEGLEEAEPLNFVRIADQFIIPLPTGELQVGQRWEADYVATVALAEEAQYMIGKARYAYMGRVVEKGIACYKVSVSFALAQDESIKETEGGTSWATYTGHGTMYLAVEGKYIVKSQIVTDLSFLMILEVREEGNFVNFIRSKIEQNIELLTTTP